MKGETQKLIKGKQKRKYILFINCIYVINQGNHKEKYIRWKQNNKFAQRETSGHTRNVNENRCSPTQVRELNKAMPHTMELLLQYVSLCSQIPCIFLAYCNGDCNKIQAHWQLQLIHSHTHFLSAFSSSVIYERYFISLCELFFPLVIL